MSLFTSERTLAALSQYGYRNGVLVLGRANDTPDAATFQMSGSNRIRRLNKPVGTAALLHAVRDALRDRKEKSRQ
jgi:hypothetical protein